MVGIADTMHFYFAKICGLSGQSLNRTWSVWAQSLIYQSFALMTRLSHSCIEDWSTLGTVFLSMRGSLHCIEDWSILGSLVFLSRWEGEAPL